jgi:hypothetical protein
MDPVNPWLDPSEVRHLAEQLLRPVAPAHLSATDPGFGSTFVGFTSGNGPVPNEEFNPSLIAEAPPEPEPVAPFYQPVAEEHPPEPEPATPFYQPVAEELPPEPEPAALFYQPVAEEQAPAISEYSPTASELVSVLPEPQPVEPTHPLLNPEPPPAAPSRTRFLQRVHIFRDWLSVNFNASDIFILDRQGKVIFDESGHGRLHFMARNLAITSRGSENIHVKIGPAAILEVIPCETAYGHLILGALVPESLPANHIQVITEVLIQTASPA